VIAACILFDTSLSNTRCKLCSWYVRRAHVCAWVQIAFGDDLTGFIGRNKFITRHIYNNAGASSGDHMYENCISLHWFV
jgi:hypothetical protein